MNQIDADYTTVFLLPPSIEDWVALDDPARFIRAFVESLDLKEMGFKTKDCSDGRPSYSASLLLKIWLFGSFEHVHSSRKLERECKRNVALIWLTGMNYPDHNTLWRFFADNKKSIKDLFKKSVLVALKNNLVGMVYHAIDGTKLGANASRYKSLNKEEMKKFVTRLDDYIEAMETEIQRHEKGEPDNSLPKKLQDTKELHAQIKATVELLMHKEKTTLSPVDPDSRRMKNSRGTTEYAYNAQAVADDKNGIITAALISQAESDQHLLTEMLDEVNHTAGSTAKQSVADAGYFSGEQLEKIEGCDYTTDVYVNIPKDHNKTGEKSSEHPYHCSKFTYNKEQDVFICPHGAHLRRKSIQGEFLVYKCHEFKCCPYKGACTNSKHQKLLTMHKNHELIRAHKKKIETQTAKELLKKRKGLIERVFGWIKEQYGLRRLKAVGIENARAYWYLTCATYNLRKVWSCKGVHTVLT